MVIAVINADPTDSKLLTLLDSIVVVVPSLSVVAVPAIDFSSVRQDTSLYNLQNSIGERIVISRSAFVRKSSSGVQHPLFKWLTFSELNGHFDRDVEQSGQLFFINERGVLYGVLVRPKPADIAEALKLRINQ